jgi:hypothetical protein
MEWPRAGILVVFLVTIVASTRRECACATGLASHALAGRRAYGSRSLSLRCGARATGVSAGHDHGRRLSGRSRGDRVHYAGRSAAARFLADVPWAGLPVRCFALRSRTATIGDCWPTPGFRSSMLWFGSSAGVACPASTSSRRILALSRLIRAAGRCRRLLAPRRPQP